MKQLFLSLARCLIVKNSAFFTKVSITPFDLGEPIGFDDNTFFPKNDGFPGQYSQWKIRVSSIFKYKSSVLISTW